MQELLFEIHGRNVSLTRRRRGRGHSERSLSITMRLIRNWEKKMWKYLWKKWGEEEWKFELCGLCSHKMIVIVLFGLKNPWIYEWMNESMILGQKLREGSKIAGPKSNSSVKTYEKTWLMTNLVLRLYVRLQLFKSDTCHFSVSAGGEEKHIYNLCQHQFFFQVYCNHKLYCTMKKYSVTLGPSNLTLKG